MARQPLSASSSSVAPALAGYAYSFGGTKPQTSVIQQASQCESQGSTALPWLTSTQTTSPRPVLASEETSISPSVEVAVPPSPAPPAGNKGKGGPGMAGARMMMPPPGPLAAAR